MRMLNEEEINKFLARSDDDDDESDWDEIAEADANEYLKPPVKSSGKTNPTAPEHKVTKRKDVVTFRKITDIGIDALFCPPSKPEEEAASTSAGHAEDEEDMADGNFLNATGQFVEKRLRDLEQLSAEQRVDREIQQIERVKKKEEFRGGWKSEPAMKTASEPTGDWMSTPASSQTSTTISEAQRKDYFVPNGTFIRVVKPRLSSTSWQDKILNRKVCALSPLRADQIEKDLASLDWLTVGVVVYPPDVRRSRGGAGPPYSIWRLSDLDNLDRIVSLFLFGSAHQNLWKEAAAGLVVALLRPRLSSSNGSGAKTEESKDSKQEGRTADLTLTIDNPQQALVLGLSKDFATCSSRTKAGAMCKRIVNRALCEYCEFHVRQLYSSSGNSRPGFSQAIGVQAKRLAGSGRGRGARQAPLAPSRPKDTANASSQLRLLSKMSGPGAAQLASHLSQMTGHQSATYSQNAPSNGASVLSQRGATSSQHAPSNGTSVLSQRGATTSQHAPSNGASVLSKRGATSSHNAPSNGTSVLSKRGATSSQRSLTNGASSASNFNRTSSGESVVTRAPKAEQRPTLQRGVSEPVRPTLSSSITSFQSFFHTHETTRPPSLSDPSKDLRKVPLGGRKSEPPLDPARARAIALVRSKGGVQAMQAQEKHRRLSSRIEESENAQPADTPTLFPKPRAGSKRSSISLEPFPVGQASASSGEVAKPSSNAKRAKVLAATRYASEEALLEEIERGSKHTSLVAAEELNQEERYFRALEFREKYEDKLAKVREHQVPIVACKVCKYRAEGRQASALCLRDHPQAVRHGKGMRRYFVCGDCRERTTTLEKIPTLNCRKCGGSNFQRTGMLRERRGPKLVDETLQTRGEEHSKFFGSDV